MKDLRLWMLALIMAGTVLGIGALTADTTTGQFRQDVGPSAVVNR